jgi:hypothetical protein
MKHGWERVGEEKRREMFFAADETQMERRRDSNLVQTISIRVSSVAHHSLFPFVFLFVFLRALCASVVKNRKCLNHVDSWN